MHDVPRLLLFGGPAGAGKTTLAAAWCATRPLAVHLQLDEVRSLIVAGLADPQSGDNDLVSEQYDVSVLACCRLAAVFLDAGYDVVIDDVLEPDAFERIWQPALGNRSYSLIIVLPELQVTLQRSRSRQKRVREDITRHQHVVCSQWREALRLDTSGLSIEESLALARRRGLLPSQP